MHRFGGVGKRGSEHESVKSAGDEDSLVPYSEEIYISVISSILLLMGMGIEREKRMSLKKKRLREIPFGKLEEIKEKMGFSWTEIADLLGVKYNQVKCYRTSGRVPATRYYAVRDALLTQHIATYKDNLSMIEELFNCSTH